MGLWRSWERVCSTLRRSPVRSRPAPRINAGVAQLAERRYDNPEVAGSSPAFRTKVVVSHARVAQSGQSTRPITVVSLVQIHPRVLHEKDKTETVAASERDGRSAMNVTRLVLNKNSLQTLVVDMREYPHRIVSWERAFTQVYKGRVEVLASY